MRRKICFVTKTPVLGGTEKHLLDLLAGLDPERVDAQVICLRADVFSESLNRGPSRNVQVETLPEPVGFRGFRALFARHRPDVVVFVVGVLGLFSWRAYLAARAAPGRRVVAIEHLIADRPSGEPPSRNDLLGRVRALGGWRARQIAPFRLAGFLSHCVICVSDAVRRRLVEDYGYPASRTITIHNGVSVDRYHPDPEAGRAVRRQFEIGTDATLILCVASLVPQKRVDVLLEALGALRAEGRAFRCLILGDGPLRAKLEAQRDALALTDAVRFAGFVTDVRPYLQASDLFVLSSDKEGMPLALLEAMASGVPCVVTDAGGNREIVVNGQTGLIVEAGSSEKFGGALRQALTNRDQMRTQAATARRLVHEQWRLETTVERLVAAVTGL